MSTKQLVIEALQKLPDDADFIDINEKIALLAALQEAEDDFATGRVVSHEEVERRLEQWLAE
jgi:predicted transcriptional regulator